MAEQAASSPVPFVSGTAVISGRSASSSPNVGVDRSNTEKLPLVRRTGSNISGRVRSASLRLAEAPIPTGAWSGFGQSVGKAPSLQDIRRGSVASSEPGGIQRRGTGLSQRGTRSRAGTASAGAGLPATLLEGHDEATGENAKASRAVLVRNKGDEKISTEEGIERTPTQSSSVAHGEDRPMPAAKGTTQAAVNTTNSVFSPSHRAQPRPNDLGIYPNGYRFPPKKTWGEATALGLKGLVRFALTPIGFLIVVYGCNVIAWGGMLFLLLCNASPAMCQLSDGRYDCNDIDSPRRVWIEYDSQVLTGLFCVTAFGLAPWRFRDLWYWALWRLARRQDALRKLAGYKKGWFRLRGSDDLPDGLGPDSKDADFIRMDEALYPRPRRNVPAPPLTGARAPSSAYWKMDFVVWCMVWNTFFQCVLCGLMWGFLIILY